MLLISRSVVRFSLAERKTHNKNRTYASRRFGGSGYPLGDPPRIFFSARGRRRSRRPRAEKGYLWGRLHFPIPLCVSPKKEGKYHCLALHSGALGTFYNNENNQ